MREKERKIAEQFGILERCESFEADLLQVKDIVPDKSDDGISFDLDGLLNGIRQVSMTSGPTGRITGRRGRRYGRALSLWQRSMIFTGQKTESRTTANTFTLCSTAEKHGFERRKI